ncbi:MAG: AI-2E family transporter [bacterium]|nr:AI-2E family transporter [bacterium]
MRKKEQLDKIFKLSILAALLVLLLYYGGSIIFPLVFAFFISLALLTPARWLEKIGVPRNVSSLLVVLLANAAVFALMIFVSFEGYQLVETLNLGSGQKVVPILEEFGGWLENKSTIDIPDKEKAINSTTQKVISVSGTVLQRGASMLQSTLVFMSLVPIYTFFMLSYRGRWKKFLNDFLSKRGSKAGMEIFEKTGEMIKSYLGGLVLVIAAVTVLYGVGLHLLEVPFATFLALVTAILIVIPYVGAVIGAVLPVVIALITMDSPLYALAVLGVYIAVQVIEGYLLTPYIVGRSVDLNPLVIIIGMIVFGALGGLLGLLLAVPIIATVKIILSSMGDTEPIAELLEQKSDK